MKEFQKLYSELENRTVQLTANAGAGDFGKRLYPTAGFGSMRQLPREIQKLTATPPVIPTRTGPRGRVGGGVLPLGSGKAGMSNGMS